MGQRPHVLIAGGGIGGLTAALALLRRSFDVDVYEQAGALREVGAGVQISANGSRALAGLGIGDAVAAALRMASATESMVACVPASSAVVSVFMSNPHARDGSA